MWLLLLAACAKDPVVKTVAAEDGAVELHLFNPTSCTGCDPFEGVDTIDLDVLQDGEVIATASYAWPGAELTLPPLEGFGVIQVRMTGRRAGAVVSFGQTPELPLGPGRTVSANLQFLPANVALPLTAPPLFPRIGHQSFALRDGRVLLVGGSNPGGDRIFTSVEAYDPDSGLFADTGLTLPAGLAWSPTATFADGQRLLVGGVGGYDPEGHPAAATDVLRFDEELGTFESLTPLPFGRLGASVSAYREGQALLVGGHAEARSRGELLRLNADDGAWHLTDVYFEDLDDRLVTGAAPLADGRTFVQGSTAASTGIWAFSEENTGVVTPEAAFLPTPADDPGSGAAFVTGAALVPLANGDVWVGGGVDSTTGSLAGVSRVVAAATQRFGLASAQPAVPRAFGPVVALDDAGTVAWGCGYRDGARTAAIANVELFNVETGASGPVIPLVDPRAGCDLAVLPDGSILITGGTPTLTAEIVRPYLE